MNRQADAVFAHLRAHVADFASGKAVALSADVATTVSRADEFTYVDPVDGSVSANQGVRFYLADGSRVVFRLSGTVSRETRTTQQGSVGATIRVYFERHVTDASQLGLVTADALQHVVRAGLALADIVALTGRTEPTVIT